MSKDTKIQWCHSSLNLQMGCDGCENFQPTLLLRDELKLTGLPLGAPLKRGDGHYFIDYTHDLWERSEGIVQGIVGLRKMIVALYSTKEGIAHLLTGGGERIMLQAPAKAEPPKGKAKKK